MTTQKSSISKSKQRIKKTKLGKAQLGEGSPLTPKRDKLKLYRKKMKRKYS
jgi:hypothetical protein